MAGKPTYEELEQRVTELEKESFKRNHVEEAQKCETGHLKALLDGLSSTNIGVDIVSIDYEVLQQNKFLADRFGNIVGKKCYKEYMALEEPCDFCPMVKSLRNKRLDWVELRASDGRNYELLSAPLTNPDGTVDRAIEVVLDITERRQSERELLFKEDIIESSSSTIATCNLEGKMTFGNPSFLQTWGFDDLREFVGRDFSEFWEVKDRLDEIMHALQTEGRWFGEIQARRKDGTLFDVQVLAATVYNAEGMPIGLTSTSIDISERKQTEEALRKSEEKYRSLFDEALDMIHIVDENGKIIDANIIEIERMEYTREEYLGKQLLEIIHPNHRSGTKTRLKNVLKGEELKAYKTALITKKGEKIDVEVTAVPQIKDGKIIAARAISRDITERERAEEKLEILSSAIEQSYNSIAVFDLEGKTVYANLKLREAYGLSPEKAIGKNWRSFIPEHSTLVEDFKEIADIVFRKGMSWKGEISERTEKGEEIWREATIFPVRNKKGEIVHATYITEDITKRKQTEEELKAQSQNLKETNMALNALIYHRDQDKKELEEKIISNVKEMVFPYIEKLQTSQLSGSQMVYLDIIKSHLSDIIAPFFHKLSSKYSGLTPSEIKVASFVKDGKTTKEIAGLLSSSVAAIEFHRNNLRKKLGLRNKKTNLRTHLLSLS